MKKIIQLLFLFVCLPLQAEIPSAAAIDSLMDRAQQLYIESEYEEAEMLFSEVINTRDISTEHYKDALNMKALLCEKYLGKLDSAVHFYALLLQNPSMKQRKRKTIERKLDFITSLGDEKEAYSTYQKIIYTNSDEESRTTELVSFIESYPQFRLLKDALKQCAVAGLNCGMYNEAFRAYQRIQSEFDPLSESEMNQFNLCKRMYIHSIIYSVTILVWVLLGLVITYELFNRKRFGRIVPAGLKVPAIIWGVVLSVIWIIYFVKIQDGDHNPLRFFDMVTILSVSTLSILLNYYVQTNSISKVYRLCILLLTTLTILSVSHFALYNRSNRITIMEDMGDQIMDIFQHRNG